MIGSLMNVAVPRDMDEIATVINPFAHWLRNDCNFKQLKCRNTQFEVLRYLNSEGCECIIKRKWHNGQLTYEGNAGLDMKKFLARGMESYPAEKQDKFDPGVIIAYGNPVRIRVLRTGNKIDRRYIAKGPATPQTPQLKKHAKSAPAKGVKGKKNGGVSKNAKSRRAKIHRLLERDGEGCWFCGQPMGEHITIEHLVAKANGGDNSDENTVLAHPECNNMAANLPVEIKYELRKHLRAQHENGDEDHDGRRTEL